METEIIAEIGDNHNGDIELAKGMIMYAALNGADIVKFQSYNEACIRKEDPERDWFLKASLSNEDHFELKEHAEKHNVEFLSSPFSRERADFLVNELGLTKLKIASCMIYNEEFLEFAWGLDIDKLYVSTGLASVGDIEDVVGQGWGSIDICLMHCVSLYPCKDELANVGAVRNLLETFGYDGYQIGYSDHTTGIDACVAAVAAGASVIEKHFVIRKDLTESTDVVVSADVAEFAEMVRRIRRTEILLGEGIKRPCAEELKNKEFLANRFIV